MFDCYVWGAKSIHKACGWSNIRKYLNNNRYIVKFLFKQNKCVNIFIKIQFAKYVTRCHIFHFFFLQFILLFASSVTVSKWMKSSDMHFHNNDCNDVLIFGQDIHYFYLLFNTFIIQYIISEEKNIGVEICVKYYYFVHVHLGTCLRLHTFFFFPHISYDIKEYIHQHSNIWSILNKTKVSKK